MATHDVVYAWERLPEYRSTQQLGRTVGRILMSLPRRLRRPLGRTLIRAPILVARGIAGANAELPPDHDLTWAERETFRTGALEALSILRDAFRLLRSERLGSQADVLVALELLERIEQGLTRRPDRRE